jgi:hypothetical protein
MNHETLQYSVWLAMAVVIAVYLVLCVVLFGYLKRNHTIAWEKLGSPSLFWNNSPRNNVLFLRFLLRRDYEKLNDATLTRMAVVTASLGGLALALFLATAAVFVADPRW